MATALHILTERSDNLGEGLIVDREAGIIRGVKILGLNSRNRRSYLREAVAQAKPLYEGVAVNIDHRAKPGDSRNCQERFGEFRAVEQRADGSLWGDLHYLKSHGMADRVCEAAERGLKTFGMSHDVKGRTAQRNGETVVEAIVSVASVDLVADAATTSGLFESEDHSMELQEQVTKLTADVVKLNADLEAANQAKAALQEQVDAYKADAEKLARKDAVSKLIEEAKLDPAKVPASLRSIAESQSPEVAKQLIGDLAESLRVGKPQSRGGNRPESKDAGPQVNDAKSFVSAIRA